MDIASNGWSESPTFKGSELKLCLRWINVTAELETADADLAVRILNQFLGQVLGHEMSVQ